MSHNCKSKVNQPASISAPRIKSFHQLDDGGCANIIGALVLYGREKAGK